MPTKILVADDSATMRRVLEMTFAGEDATVVSVDSGEAAVAKLADFGADIVFADATLAGVDGYELARRIKSHPSYSSVAVIVMASQHTPYDETKGRAAGVDDNISKPFDTQSVIDRVGQVLSRPRNLPVGAEAPRAAAPAAPAAPQAPAPQAPAPQAPAPQATAAARPITPAAVTPVGAAQAPAQMPSRVVQGTRIGMGAPAAPVPLAPAAAARPQAPAIRPNATLPMSPVPPNAPKVIPAGGAPAASSVSAVARPQAQAPAAAPVGNVASATAGMSGKLEQLGLTREQIEGVLALSREVITQVVWEVVPDLAEQLIKEEIKRLTAE